MGSQAEAASHRQTPRGVGRGGGLQPESVGGLISTPQPRGLANLRGPQPRQVLARQSQAVKPIANWLRFQGESAVREGEGAARVC